MSNLKRQKRKPLRPYLYLAALLFNKFSWVERHSDGSMTIPIRRWCSHFHARADEVGKAFSWLYSIGILSEFKWHGHWAHVKPAVPEGMCRMVGAVMDMPSDGVIVEEINTIDIIEEGPNDRVEA